MKIEKNNAMPVVRVLARGLSLDETKKVAGAGDTAGETHPTAARDQEVLTESGGGSDTVNGQVAWTETVQI